MTRCRDFTKFFVAKSCKQGSRSHLIDSTSNSATKILFTVKSAQRPGGYGESQSITGSTRRPNFTANRKKVACGLRTGGVLRSYDNLPNDVIVAMLSIVSGSGSGEVNVRSGGARMEEERKTASVV